MDARILENFLVKAVGGKTRLKVFLHLCQNAPQRPVEIKQAFPKKNIYYHLRELRKAGLIKLSEGSYDLTERGREICKVFLDLARALHTKNQAVKVLEENGFIQSYLGIEDFFEKKGKFVSPELAKEFIKKFSSHFMGTESVLMWTLLESINGFNSDEAIIGLKNKTLNLIFDLEVRPLFKYFRIVEHIEAIFRQNAILHLLNHLEKIKLKDAFLNGEVTIRRPEFSARGLLSIFVLIRELDNNYSLNLIKHLLKLQHCVGEVYISGISNLKIEDPASFLENLSIAMPGKGRITLIIEDYDMENEETIKLLSYLSPRYESIRLTLNVKDFNPHYISTITSLLNSGVPVTFNENSHKAEQHNTFSQFSIIVPAIFSRQKGDMERILQDEISSIIETIRKGLYENGIPKTLQEYLESSFRVKFDDAKIIIGIIGLNIIYESLRLKKDMRNIISHLLKIWESLATEKNSRVEFTPVHLGDEPYYSYELAKKQWSEPVFSCISPLIYEGMNFDEYLQAESMLQRSGIDTLVSVKLPQRRISAEETRRLIKNLQRYNFKKYYIHRDFTLCLRCYSLSYKRRFTCQSCGSVMQTRFISPFSYWQLEKRVHPQARAEYESRPTPPERFFVSE